MKILDLSKRSKCFINYLDVVFILASVNVYTSVVKGNFIFPMYIIIMLLLSLRPPPYHCFTQHTCIVSG